MKIRILFCLIFFYCSNLKGQSNFDDFYPKDKMEKDLSLFIEIRKEANSGLYKYKNKSSIDSLYADAYLKIQELDTYSGFYNLLCSLTAYEGSCHNVTLINDKILKEVKLEKEGYFPYPIEMIEKKIVVNFDQGTIPLGATILSINGISAENILKELSKYANTDGNNAGGKDAFYNDSFSKYFRYNFGKQNTFLVSYKAFNQELIQETEISSIGYAEYYDNYDKRFYNLNSNENQENYSFEIKAPSIAVLTINSFSISDTEKYKNFLDEVLKSLESKKIPSLIIDIRKNSGGSPPHDMLTLSCFTSGTHKEIQSAWVSMPKIPYWKHFKIGVPFFLRPIAKLKINKLLKQSFPRIEGEKRFYTDIKEYDPHPNAFKGKVYLLLDSDVASASSLFAAMMISYTNTTSVGEETMGAYYGHNGVFQVVYQLPKSKIKTAFSIVNLEQDVLENKLQSRNRGIIPNHIVSLTIPDLLAKKDTQMEYVLNKLTKSYWHNQAPVLQNDNMPSYFRYNIQND